MSTMRSTITGEVTIPVWDVECDAAECCHIMHVPSQPVYDNVNFGYDDAQVLTEAGFCEDREEAVDACVRIAGWQMGTEGVQRGHLYCPKHRQEWS